MIPLASIRELYDYNYWARDRQLEACAALTPEQFLRPMGNSFSSVRDTLAHMVGTEWVWRERWYGSTTQEMLALARASSIEAYIQNWAQQFPSLHAIAQRWRTEERMMREYLMELDEEMIAKPFNYASFAGKRWSYPLWRTLFHLLNHQTYHRGQITTLLRQLGVPAAQIDFLIAHDQGFQ